MFFRKIYLKAPTMKMQDLKTSYSVGRKLKRFFGLFDFI